MAKYCPSIVPASLDERKIIANTTSGAKISGQRANLMSLAAQQGPRVSLRCGAVPLRESPSCDAGF
jgi:hypothetical protein